jgi:Response regulator containing a CheY-like receiver domain and an HD-GYP domain
MSHVAGLIAEQLGLPEEEVRVIEMAAPLHDMGKIAIPDAVLLKPGKLDEEEMAVMRRHPRIGYELLSGSQNRFIQVAALIALRHHERYDGSGYPDGLVGEAIPLEARMWRWPTCSTRCCRRARTRTPGAWMPRWPTSMPSVAACSARAALTR